MVRAEEVQCRQSQNQVEKVMLLKPQFDTVGTSHLVQTLPFQWQRLDGLEQEVVEELEVFHG